ncbi:MAG: endonuclease/exonuclease/phosphatase family protein [Proteobacteria bacterium]|nr:endonuclease/exonuclease/phosphatase family protein [Pseudomonadota bacterium]
MSRSHPTPLSPSRIAAELPAPPPAIIAAARSAPHTREEHDRLSAAIPALATIEQVPPARPAPVGDRITVAAFNVERGSHPEAAARLIADARVDAALLTELDIGMARSGNRHTLRELAGPLGAGYALGVEFVELGLGDSRERAWHAGVENAIGLHGNAVLSRHRLTDPARIALDDGALWFDGARNGERRIGGRMALAARLADGKRPLWLVAVHLESHSDPADRARQIEWLLRGLDRMAGGAAAVIGGDLNTNKLPRDPSGLSALFDNPSAVEPLFERFRSAGFDWRTVNTTEPTQRTRPDGTPRPPFNRIDWLAVRGASGSSPRTVPAVDMTGRVISDHDMIVADITL